MYIYFKYNHSKNLNYLVRKLEEKIERDKETLFKLIPPESPACAAEDGEGTCESDPDNMKAISKTDTICGKSRSL